MTSFINGARLLPGLSTGENFPAKTMNKITNSFGSAAIYLWILVMFAIYLLQFENIFLSLLSSLGLT